MTEYLFIAALVALMYIANSLADLSGRIRDIEFRVNKLLEDRGIELGNVLEPSSKVKDLAQTKGAEIEAIKAYREQTGLGLKEAQAVVKSLARNIATDA